MSGYNYNEGMSNRAVDAYARGLKPLSKITKKDLVEASVDIDLPFAKWLALKGFWKPVEWHHASSKYNKVNFYAVADIDEVLASVNLNALFAQYQAETQRPEHEEKVSGKFAVWGGSRKRPYIISWEEFTGIKKGNWIHLSTGGKKKADGKYIEWK